MEGGSSEMICDCDCYCLDSLCYEIQDCDDPYKPLAKAEWMDFSNYPTTNSMFSMQHYLKPGFLKVTKIFLIVMFAIVGSKPLKI